MSEQTLLNNTLLENTNTQEELERSIMEINEIQNHLNECIISQQEKIDNFENNLSNTNNIVENAKNDLILAQKYSFSYKPVLVGSIVGGILISPLTLLTHLSIIKSFITLSGTVAGAMSGYSIQS